MSLESSLQSIFNEALEREDLAERSRYLDDACGPDHGLRQRVEKLLHAHDTAGNFLSDHGTIRIGSAPAPNTPLFEQPGQLIGRYKLLEQIGEGGCGVVYLAEQEEPVRRLVALKIIKLGMDTRSVIARFEAERQALALMDHPNIAKVLDAGATETGRPYFVMELVRGVKITDYCEQQNLSTEQRLRLFIQVCHAVQHAHQKGIIHRDLKPSNILVREENSPPTAEVIDFGIAKATGQQPLTDKTIFTAFEQFIGTPAYMSPEQAEMTGVDIDTRTDIYSLGVLLYELLTGKPPFDNHQLLTAGLDEMRRIIREVEPPRPSTRLTENRRDRGDETGETGKGEKFAGKGLVTSTSTSKSQIPQIHPDLDSIVLKCLEKDRTRRYQTALEPALDLERHLRHEPVTARPPTRLYQFQKLIRRNKVAFTATAAVVAALIIGTVVSTLALFREREARRQSDHRLKTAMAFVDEVFTQVAPEIRNLTGASSANEKLAQSSLRFVKKLNDGLGDYPALRLAVARQLVRLSEHQNPGENTIGNYEAGFKHAQEALAILNDASLDVNDSTRAELMVKARYAGALCLVALGRINEAVAEWKEGLPWLDKLETFPEWARTARQDRVAVLVNSGIALVLANRPQQALDEYLLPTLHSAWTKQVSSNRGAANHTELDTLACLHDALANAYLFLERFDQMLPLRAPATNLWNYLAQRAPQDGESVSNGAECLALHGCALLLTGSREQGLVLLDQARQIASDQVQKDGASDRFLFSRTIVTAVRAVAFAHWSNDPTSPVIERRDRLQKAEAFLAEAEEFARATKARVSESYLQLARTVVSKAKESFK